MMLRRVFLVLACLMALGEATRNPGSNGGGNSRSSGGGGEMAGSDSSNYAQNREKVYNTIDFSKAPCVKDPSPAKFGQYGCCPDPGSLPAFAKGWDVQWLDDYDAHCYSPLKGDSFVLKFKVVPGKGQHDAEALFATTAHGSPLDGSQQFVSLNPICVGTGEEKTYTFTSEELLRRGDLYGLSDTWWTLNLNDLPLTVNTVGREYQSEGPWGAYTEDDNIGGPWFANDCDALGDRIRAGKVKYPSKNKFALQVLSKSGGGGGGGLGHCVGGGLEFDVAAPDSSDSEPPPFPLSM